MKKTWIVMMTICAALVFTGCGKKADPMGTSAPASTETTAETTAAPEETTTPPASQDAPGETSEFKNFTGKVTAVSDTLEDVTIKKDGGEVTLSLQGVDIETSYALEPDTEVSVVYKGEISGTDTANAKILMIVDVQKSLEVKTVTGSVEDQAMSAFMIKLDDGQTMSFLKNNCEGLDTGVLGQANGDSNGSGTVVTVTYITVNYDASSGANFPLKVEAAKTAE